MSGTPDETPEGASAVSLHGRWRLRGLSRRTPLRIKLVVATVLLSGLALIAVGVTTTAVLHRNLLQRVDAQLTGQVGFVGGPGAGRGREGGPVLGPAAYAATLDAEGNGSGFFYPAANQTPPRLPALDASSAARLSGSPFTVPSSGAGHDWRVAVRVDPDLSGTHVVALNLADVDDTLQKLIGLDLAVSLVVLVLLGLGAYAVVRSSLRPLRRVETTAAAIAAGDLSQRVPEEASRKTEVGRLSGALNTMLGQVEHAFRDREESEAEARASEERMRRFIADASHELRTPLTSIRGFAELHRQGALGGPDAVPGMMRRIETEATRMGLLVEDLLLLARLDQQRPLEQRPVDLLELAGDAVQNARAAAPDHYIALRTSAGEDEGPPVVVGDDARLRQVVTNLMSNAVTHTPPGSHVLLNVRTDGDEAVLEVRDDGPGMAPEEADRVFERFYRADQSRVRTSGGSGLGLSIVSALVAAHGGHVALQTAPGEGAVFEVRLPLAGNPGPASDDAEPVDAGRQEAVSGRR